MNVIRLFTKKPKCIGLALGAGSARGLAHIGVLKVIEREKIPISVIAGTSAGSLIGGLFAAGKSTTELEDLIVDADLRLWTKVFLPTFPRGGLVDGKRISEFAATLIGNVEIEALPIRYAAVATDFISGEEVVIRQGPLREAIRASTSLPGIFSPLWHNKHLLCDGGLVNPVPVDICRQLGADFVIAVNVNPRQSIAATEIAVQSDSLAEQTKKGETLEEKLLGLVERIHKDGDLVITIRNWLESRDEGKILKSPFGLFEALTRSFSIVYARNLFQRSKQAKPEIILEPDTRAFSGMDFDKGEDLIKLGEVCAGPKMGEIKQRIKFKALN
jgi:NTE family protein